MIKKFVSSIQDQNKFINCIYTFSEDKPSSRNQDSYAKGDQKKQVKIDQKYRIKSAALYDKYLLSRQKPLYSLDQYQINYCWILQRIPIFLPHTKEYFSYYKNRYQMAKKTGYILPLPKQLTVEEGDYLFEQYQKANPQNIPSHQALINGQTTYYRQNARYWKYVDPFVTNERSVQNHSSDNVFFIVKNNNGQWVFPQRAITQKQSHEQFFKSFAGQIFGGKAYPNLYFDSKKPIHATKQENQNMEKGVGIKTFYYTGFSMSGIPKYPTSIFKDYKWVPKPHLYKYFSEQYCKKVIKLADFWF